MFLTEGCVYNVPLAQPLARPLSVIRSKMLYHAHPTDPNNGIA